MKPIDQLLMANKAWAKERTEDDPQFFKRLENIQTPKFLWIGCSDSRVPANEITGTEPGEIFVHRNVANMVVHTDLNLITVLEYAVHYLNVEHIIVCGHYGCGGVHAALRNDRLGLIDNWLRHVQDVMKKHHLRLAELPDEASRLHRLCELNVIEQVLNVGQTSIVQSAWDRGKALEIHGWIYDLHDGLLRDLTVGIRSAEEYAEVYRRVIED